MQSSLVLARWDVIPPAVLPDKSGANEPRHMQASTALSASFTPFILANFTQSIMVNLTNVNGTNQNPTGAPCPLLTCGTPVTRGC